MFLILFYCLIAIFLLISIQCFAGKRAIQMVNRHFSNNHFSQNNFAAWVSAIKHKSLYCLKHAIKKYWAENTPELVCRGQYFQMATGGRRYKRSWLFYVQNILFFFFRMVPKTKFLFLLLNLMVFYLLHSIFLSPCI